MCIKALEEDPYQLKYVPDHFKTQEMFNEAVRNNAAVFFLVSGRFKTQEMCIKALGVDPWQLKFVSDHFKTQEMCDKAVRDYLFSLWLVLDWLVTQQQIDIWYDDDYVYNNNEMIKWYHDYQKCKAQKASIKEELMPTAWHPDRVKDWCMSEDEKRW